MSCYPNDYQAALELAMTEIRNVLEPDRGALDRLAEAFRLARTAPLCARDHAWLCDRFIPSIALETA